MKYVFLLLLIAVAGGGYWYYGKMEQNYARDVRALEETSWAAYDDLNKKEQAALEAYEQSVSNLTQMESEYDAKMKAVREGAKKQIDTFRSERSKIELPDKASAALKRRMSELRSQGDKVQSAMRAREQAFLREEEGFLRRIAANEKKAMDKAYNARSELDRKAEKRVSSRGIRRARLEEQIAAEASAVGRINQDLRTRLEESRTKYIRDARLSYQKLDEIDREMERAYARYASPGRTGAPVAQPGAKSTELLTSVDQNFRDVRRQYQNDSNRLRQEVTRTMSEWRSVVNKAGRLANAHDGELENLTSAYEESRMYVKIIAISLSAVLALATVFVFIGSAKVEERPKSPY